MENNLNVNEAELAEKISGCESVEEIVTVLNEAGIETTQEELLAKMNEAEGELSEDSLEEVVGGTIITAKWFWKIIWLKMKSLPRPLVMPVGMGSKGKLLY